MSLRMWNKGCVMVMPCNWKEEMQRSNNSDHAAELQEMIFDFENES